METEEKTWDAEKRVRKKIVAALRRWKATCDELLAHETVLEEEQFDVHYNSYKIMTITADQADTLQLGIVYRNEEPDGKGLTPEIQLGIVHEEPGGKGLTPETESRTNKLLTELERFTEEVQDLENELNDMVQAEAQN